MSTSAIPQTSRPSFAAFGQAAQMPALVAVLYLLGAEAAFVVGTLSDKIFAPFWPPNIVLLCALLMTPARRWWIYVLAIFPAHVIAELDVGMPMPQLLVAFVTNCMVALLSAAAIQRFLGGLPKFDSLRNASRYIAITAFASPAVAALGGAFVPILGGGGLDKYWTFWMQWYVSNALGALTLGPVALIWLGEFRRASVRVSARVLTEATLLSAALVVACFLAFEVSDKKIGGEFLPALLYSPLLFVLWAATRFGAKGASGATLIVTVALIWLTLNGPSVFVVPGDAEASVFAIQAFLIGLSIPILLLGATIDQSRQAERATRESEERMAFAAASANVCLWHYDYQTNRYWMTDHGRRMFGFPAGKVVTRDAVSEAIHPDDRQAALDSIQSDASSAEPAGSEFRILRPDGEIRWIRARARTINDGRGVPSRVSGTFADITERKTAEIDAAQQRQELAHLTRASVLGELSGGIAHELTQPLTAILSNAQAARLMMDAKTIDKPEVIAALDDIIEDDNRAGEIIHRMRNLLKKGDSKLETLDLNNLVHSTLRLLHSEFIARKVTMRTDLSDQLTPISGDAVQLQQVILNLVMNAFDALKDVAPSRRTITIRTQIMDYGGIQVSISDRGTGLLATQNEQLFQPFFTTKERGLGLGLPICASIIRSHGGMLKIENNYDEGATATFNLPSQDAAAGTPVLGGVS